MKNEARQSLRYGHLSQVDSSPLRGIFWYGCKWDTHLARYNA